MKKKFGSPKVVYTVLAFQYACCYADQVVSYVNQQSGKASQEQISATLQKPDTLHTLRKQALEKVLGLKSDILVDAENILCKGSNKLSSQLFINPMGSKDFTVKYNGGTAQSMLGHTQTVGVVSISSMQTALNTEGLEEIDKQSWEKLAAPPCRVFRINLSLPTLNLTCKGQAVSRIDVVGNREQGPMFAQYMRITVVNEKDYLKRDASKSALRDLLSLRYFLPGNLFEDDTSAMERKNMADTVHWQGKDADWRLGLGGNRGTYYGLVHPKITQYVLSVIPSIKLQENAPLTILDIAGGNGDLGERLIKEIQLASTDIAIHYILVDYSQNDVDTANRRFRVLMSKGRPFKAKAYCRDMLNYNFDAKQIKQDLNLPANGVELVINSGGLLNNQIGNNPDGPALFNHLYAELMVVGGYGVYSGLTPLLVSARDHKATAMLQILNLFDAGTGTTVHVVRKQREDK